jgi:hypothetical protein
MVQLVSEPGPYLWLWCCSSKRLAARVLETGTVIEIDWEETRTLTDAPITRAEIDAETNVDKLLEWLYAFEARTTELKAFAFTWNELGWSDDAKRRFAGKISYGRMGRSWVRRRLRQLGHDPRDNSGRLTDQLRVLMEAARKVIVQRDHFSEHGTYLHPMEADQEFDDWAADILEEALPNSLAANDVT